MILICYDGSEAARAAADKATRLFHAARATVLTVWALDAEMRINAELGLGSGFGVGPNGTNETARIEALLLERARRTAEEGAKRLRAAGMAADSLVQERHRGVASTMLAVAERINADAVVVGSRRRGAAKSALTGSVSHDLVQHADRAVVVVPSAGGARHHRGPLAHVRSAAAERCADSQAGSQR